MSGGGEHSGRGAPAYLTEQGFADTYGNEQPLGVDGLFLADKLNGLRAARYVGKTPIAVATNENDPTDPASWPQLRPGDWIAIAVDKNGNAMLTPYSDGAERPDQYPVRVESFKSVPLEPIAGGRIPTVTGPEGGIKLLSSSQLETALEGLGI